MKFFLDENITLQLKGIILEQGYEVTDVYQQKLSGADDKSIIWWCKKEKYVLITNDTDFENIYAYPPNTHPGIIIFRLKSQGAAMVTKAFQSFLEKVDLTRITGTITIIGPEWITVRKEI